MKQPLQAQQFWPVSREDCSSFFARYIRIKSLSWAREIGLYLQSCLQSVQEEVWAWTWENGTVILWNLMLPRGMLSIKVGFWVGANVHVCLHTHRDGWEKPKAPPKVSLMKGSSWAEVVGRPDKSAGLSSSYPDHLFNAVFEVQK